MFLHNHYDLKDSMLNGGSCHKSVSEFEVGIVTIYRYIFIFLADVKVPDTWQPYQATLNLEKQASSLCWLYTRPRNQTEAYDGEARQGHCKLLASWALQLLWSECPGNLINNGRVQAALQELRSKLTEGVLFCKESKPDFGTLDDNVPSPLTFVEGRACSRCSPAMLQVNLLHLSNGCIQV